MVREITYIHLKVGRCVEHPKIYKVLQRGYKVIFIFLESLKVFRKSISFLESLKVLERLKVLKSLKVLGKFKSFIKNKKKNKGFFITLICLVILGMLTAASPLRFCRLLGYSRHILIIRMVREIKYNDTTMTLLYITSQLLRIYNVLQRGYNVRIIYFYNNNIRNRLCDKKK